MQPLSEIELGSSRLIDDCLDQIKVKVDSSEITSHAGNDLVTQTVADVYLESKTVRVPAHEADYVLPEFTANYHESSDCGNVDLELLFILQERTPTHAIYEVRESEPHQQDRKGIMAPSRSMLFDRQQIRLFG